MNFLHPSYFWALTALAIPIAIHLWSRREGKTIKIGSIQLLQSYDSKQFSSIQLNEKRLLLLRIFIISLLVLIMATPVVKKHTEHTPITYIVEPSLLQQGAIVAMLDTLSKGENEIRILQTGFPEWDVSEAGLWDTITPNYWQLAREMETLKTDSIVVFTRGSLKGVKGMRPGVHRKMEWIGLDDENTAYRTLKAIRKEENIHFITAYSDGERMTFNKEVLKLTDELLVYNPQKDSVRLGDNKENNFLPLETEPPVRVLLIYEEALLTEKSYLEAALGAISKYLDRSIEIVSSMELLESARDSFDLVIGLQMEFIPSTSAKQLLYKPDSLVGALMVPGPTKNVFHITKPITPENSLTENLGEKLLQLLFPNDELEEKAKVVDKRVMAKEELLPNYSTGDVRLSGVEVVDISKYLWFFVPVLLGIERFFAFYRKQ